MQLNEIKKVGILGAGTLGLRIGLRCALDGYQVCIYDIAEQQLDTAKQTQLKILAGLEKRGFISSALSAEALTRLEFTMDKNTLADKVDLVSESVTEELPIKLKVYEAFAPLWPAHTILTTNTSYLLPSQIAEATGRAERFCALHFHDVFTARVVDVMAHPGTVDWLPALLMSFGKSINQIPVLIKQETPGYVFNAMLMTLIGTAGHLVTKGLADFETVDKSWMGNMNTNIGPFGMIDQIGLDTAWHVVRHRKDGKSQRFTALLKEKIDEGRLGIKTGKGFYDYPKPAYAEKDFL